VKETSIQQNSSLLHWKDVVDFTNVHVIESICIPTGLSKPPNRLCSFSGLSEQSAQHSADRVSNQDVEVLQVQEDILPHDIDECKAIIHSHPPTIINREKVIGNIAINLSDSESPVSAALTDFGVETGSISGSSSTQQHVFSLFGWFEVDTDSKKFFRRRKSTISGSSSGHGLSPGTTSSLPSSTSSSSGRGAGKEASSTGVILRSAVAASTPTPREDCASPQLNMLIHISRSVIA
jgi:hypothetical protein